MSYNAKNHTEQGGERTVIGGKVVIENGAEVEIKDGAEITGLPSSGGLKLYNHKILFSSAQAYKKVVFNSDGTITYSTGNMGTVPNNCVDIVTPHSTPLKLSDFSYFNQSKYLNAGASFATGSFAVLGITGGKMFCSNGFDDSLYVITMSGTITDTVTEITN